MLNTQVNVNKINRLVNTCPNCNSVAYYYKDNVFTCHECKSRFDKPDLLPNTNILEYNYYVNIFPINNMIYVDGLSFGLLEKLNTILEKNGSYVNIDLPVFQAKLKMYQDTKSEFSKLQILKVREDYLDYDDMFSKLTNVLVENKEGPLSSETFDVNIKAPVFMMIQDMYDLEQLVYDLSKEVDDGEIEALLEMFAVINKSMDKSKS